MVVCWDSCIYLWSWNYVTECHSLLLGTQFIYRRSQVVWMPACWLAILT